MSEYYYLISSLPMLMPEESPPFSTDEFMSMCSSWLSKNLVSQLEVLSLVPQDKTAFPEGSAAENWYDWESTLRNAIVVSRSSKLGKEPENFKRPAKGAYSEIERGVQEASGAQNPLQREKIFDRIRWEKLDDMESSHLFDFYKICVYKIKLMILEKWAGRVKEDGKEKFDQILENVYSGKDEEKKEEE